MKINLTVSFYLPNVYAKFHIDISNHAEKGQTDGRMDITIA